MSSIWNFVVSLCRGTFGWLDQFVHLLSVCGVILLVGFLVATTLLQGRSVAGALGVLDKIDAAIKKTKLFADAQEYFQRRDINPFSSPSHLIPIWFLIVVVFLGAMMAFFGAEFLQNGTIPNYVLGGTRAAVKNAQDLAAYQSSTVFIASVAFLSAYVWLIGRLITRLYCNDMSPTSYYFLSVRILTAVLVAALTRHIIEAIPGLRQAIYANDQPVGLAAIGFVIGWNPSLWIDDLMKKINEWWKSSVSRPRPPGSANMPENMALTMIQGLDDDAGDRLNELGIDNFQDLSQRNPLVIWLRTRYTLELVVDWIGQSQLCVLYESDSVELLRRVGIRDIFAYRTAIDTDPGRDALAGVLHQLVPKSLLETHRTAIDQDPAYQNIEQLRTAISLSN